MVKKVRRDEIIQICCLTDIYQHKEETSFFQGNMAEALNNIIQIFKNLRV